MSGVFRGHIFWKNSMLQKRRINILLLAIVCIGLVFRLYLSSYKFLDWDESNDLYAGINFLEGKGLKWPEDMHECLPVRPILSALLYEATKNPDFSVSFIFVVFGGLIAIPVYLISKRLYGEKAGYIGALLTTFIPSLNTTIIQFSIHPVFLFFLYCGIYASLLAYQENKVLYYLLAGVFLTLGSFTRGEGQAYFLVLIVILLATRVLEKNLLKQETIRGLILMSTLFLTSFLVLNTSILYKHEGLKKYSYDTFTMGHARAYKLQGGDIWQRSKELTNKLYGTPVENEYSVLKAIKKNPRSFFDYLIQNAGLFFTKLTSVNVFPFFLFLFVLLAFPMDRKGERGSLFLLVSSMPVFVYLIFVVQERLLTSVVPVLIVWSARGLCVLEESLMSKYSSPERKVRLFVKVPVVFTVLCLSISTLAYARAIDTRGWEARKVAGEYLRNNAQKDERVMALIPPVALYGDLEYKKLPSNYVQLVKQARENNVKYLFLEDSTKQHRPNLVFLMNAEKHPEELKVLIDGEIRGYKFVLYEFSR